MTLIGFIIMEFKYIAPNPLIQIELRHFIDEIVCPFSFFKYVVLEIIVRKNNFRRKKTFECAVRCEIKV